jgi:catechol 2,3-dioxygenase-like lactoylglutathione lyase family enzyme
MSVKIILNHTIVAVSNRKAAAHFFAELAGLSPPTPAGPFMAVSVNGDLTLDFDDRHGAHPSHYGFLVDGSTLDYVLAAAHRLGARYGSGPEHGWDQRTYTSGTGRGVYVEAPDGHSYEFFTSASIDDGP